MSKKAENKYTKFRESEITVYLTNDNLPEKMNDGTPIPRIGDIIDGQKVHRIDLDLDNERIIIRNQKLRWVKGTMLRASVGRLRHPLRDLLERNISKKDEDQLIDEMKWIAMNGAEKNRAEAIEKILNRKYGRSLVNESIDINVSSPSLDSVIDKINSLFGLGNPTNTLPENNITEDILSEDILSEDTEKENDERPE